MPTTFEASPARTKLRTSVARILDLFVEREATEEELTQWAAIAGRYADQLQGAVPETVMWGLGSRGMWSVAGVPPKAQIDVRPQDVGDSAEAVATFGAEHQGHHGFVHGGCIAAAFDEVTGMCLTAGQRAMVTAELRVRYLRLLPLHQTVKLTANIERTEGVRLWVKASASVEGIVYAEAEAEFAPGRGLR